MQGGQTYEIIMELNFDDGQNANIENDWSLIAWGPRGTVTITNQDGTGSDSLPYVTRRSSDGASTTGINNGQDNSANNDSSENSNDNSGDSGDSSNGGSSDGGSSDGGSSGGGSSDGGSSGGSSNGGSTTTGTGMPPEPPSYSWQLEDDQEDFLSWAENYDIYNGQQPEYCSAGLYQEYI